MAGKKEGILILTGQTATGKTGLALKLAQFAPIEIISADARQVYVGMDIGTGKIGSGDVLEQQNHQWSLNNVPIHGINLIDPSQTYSSSDFVTYAQRKISEIKNRGHIPIIVGGTGFYIKSLFLPDESLEIPPNEEKRSVWRILEATNSLHDFVAILQNELHDCDASRLEAMNNSDKNNPRRLMRAIEVCAYKREYNYTSTVPSHTYEGVWVSLQAETGVLEQAITQRVHQMIEMGLESEVSELHRQYTFNSAGLKTMGYYEWQDYFTGHATIHDIVQQIITHNRQYARKQTMYLKRYPFIQWFDLKQRDAILQTCIQTISSSVGLK